MVATMNETDIDRFIREQKSKLVNERSHLGGQGFSDESPSILKLGQYENHRKKLQEERHNEYKDYLQSKESSSRKEPPQSVRSQPYEEQFNVQTVGQHLRELQEMSTRKLLSDHEIPPQRFAPSNSVSKKPQRKKEAPQNDFFASLGEYENKKKKLKEERERDLKRHLAQNSSRDESLVANNKPLSSRENHIMWADQGYPGDRAAAPPLYRGADYNSDYPYSRVKTSASDRAVNHYDLDLRDRANEYSARLSQPNLHEEIENRLRPLPSSLPPVSNSFLDDPLWARLRENPQKIGGGLASPRSTLIMPDEYMKSPPLNNEDRRSHGPPQQTSGSSSHLFMKDPVSAAHSRNLPDNKTETYATSLQLGNNHESMKERQKHNYREELQKQMRERNEMRLRERQMDQMPHDASLNFAPHQKPNQHPHQQQQHQQQHPPPEYDMDHLSQPINGRKFEHHLQQRGSDFTQLLGQNFDQHQRQNISNNFMYEPLLFDGQNNSIDKAHTFYGMKGHFDDLPAAHDVNILSQPLKKPTETNYVPQQTSYSNGPSQKQPGSLGPSAMLFGRDESRSAVKKRDQDYMRELERQMQEKKIRKHKLRQEQDRYDQQLEEQNKHYNPYGRGGGGAPLKDSSGNVLANLRQMKPNDATSALLNPITSPTAMASLSPRAPSVQQSQEFDKDPFLGTPPDPTEEPTHARGGHGIFGEPKTDAQKTAMDKYREELQKQMIDKRNQKLLEAERERLEEEKYNQRLEEERQKIQDEFEEEEKKKKAKQEEEKKAQAEMRRLIEEKKKAEERKRKEEDEKILNENIHLEKINSESPQADTSRPRSPPVPALQRKINSESRANSDRQESPPTPQPSRRRLSTHGTNEVKIHQETKPPLSPKSRAQSADLLNQLKVLRKGLQQKYLESEMRRNSAAHLLEPPTDVLFNQKAVLLRRGSHNIVEPPPPNSDALQDFNQLKYRKQTGSRDAFRSEYPDSPLDLDTLELQQRALIDHQEKTLQNISHNGSFRGHHEHEHPPLLRQKTVSPQPMLDSKSAFFDADSMPLLSDMFSDNRIQKTDSARSRRRRRLQSPLQGPLDNVSLRSNSAGSNISLNPDKIARKNEARLRKLQNMNDAVSLTEPEDILERFIAKQDYNRQPSTLFDGYN